MTTLSCSSSYPCWGIFLKDHEFVPYAATWFKVMVGTKLTPTTADTSAGHSSSDTSCSTNSPPSEALEVFCACCGIEGNSGTTDEIRRPISHQRPACAVSRRMARQRVRYAGRLIRYPSAFAPSVKRFGWTYPFAHFTEQPLIMRDHLAPFKAEARAYSINEYDPLDHSILLWRLIHHAVYEYR